MMKSASRFFQITAHTHGRWRDVPQAESNREILTFIRASNRNGQS